MNDLAGKHIVLGLTGGIACYKAAELCRALLKEGATVQIVMTEAAKQFITPVTMQALSNRPVCDSQWDAREPNNMAHINLSREADAILIAPCSADFMSKLVHGGVRYLAQGNISLVREALHERTNLLNNAPHLAQRLAFVMPSYTRQRCATARNCSRMVARYWVWAQATRPVAKPVMAACWSRRSCCRM